MEKTSRWRALTGLDGRSVIFSLNSFVAAMLALYIGFRFGLPRPYWAMLTVYITAQPLSGALRSKAAYRVLGTMLGATAAVALVPSLVDAPELLSLALALWTGLCLYLSLLDRTPRAYVFMLAGYTAPIIGFPSVNAPAEVFTTAISRVEEITLGIACATVVHSLVFPRSVAPALSARISAYIRDAQRWIGDAVQVRPEATVDRERRRLAGDLAELHALSTHLPFDTSNLRPRLGAVRALQDRIAILLPLATGLEDRLAALRGELGTLPEDVAALLGELEPWLRDEAGAREQADAFADRARALEPPVGEGAAWSTLLQASALARLVEMIEALQDCRDLRAYIADPRRQIPPHLDPVVRARARRPLHRDHGLAALSGFAAVVAMLLVCAGWILTAWPDGAVAAMMAGVFCSFFATQDDPAPALISFMIFTVLSLPIALLYLVVILPAIDGFPLLIAVLAPVMLVLGYFQGRPKSFGKAMPMIIGVAGALSLQETFAPNIPGFINSNLAQVIGIAAAVAVTRLFRTIGAEWSARRVLRSAWRELARLATPGAPVDRPGLTSRMLDRLGLLTPRLALADPREDLLNADLLNDLRIGLNVSDIKRARDTGQRDATAAIDDLLRRLSARFAALAAGRSPGDEDLSVRIDNSLRALSKAPTSAEQRAGLLSLAGLRRNLCPGSPAYQPTAAGEGV